MSNSLYSHQFATPDPVQLQTGWGVLDNLRRDPPGTWSGNQYLQTTKYTGPIYLAIQTIMKAMGSLVPQVQRKARHTNKTTFLGGNATIKKSMGNPNSFGQDHEYVPAEKSFPVCDLLDHPNERGDTFKDVLRYLILQHRLTGIAPLWCVPNAKHQPVELYALPTALTLPQYSRSEQYPNGAYRLQPYYSSGAMGYMPGLASGQGCIIPAEEIRRRRDPHPLLLWDGYSPLTAGAVELDILQAIDECWWAVLDHGVILDTVLMLPGQDTGAVTRISQNIKAKHGGARNARNFFALGGGDPNAKYDVKQLSPNVREMDFPNGRATMLEFCLALFGVPADVANMSGQDAGSFSKLYANIQKFRLLTLQPDAQEWADFLSRWLCDPWSKNPGDYRIKLELPALNDPDLELQKDKADVNIMTVNQRLARRDLPPVEFGEFPEPIYLAKLQQKETPQPEMLPTKGPDARDDNREDGAVGGGVAPPENKGGLGSRGPMLKAAMSSIGQTTGGALVAPAARKVVKGRKAKRMLSMMVCKALKED